MVLSLSTQPLLFPKCPYPLLFTYVKHFPKEKRGGLLLSAPCCSTIILLLLLAEASRRSLSPENLVAVLVAGTNISICFMVFFATNWFLRWVFFPKKFSKWWGFLLTRWGVLQNWLIRGFVQKSLQICWCGFFFRKYEEWNIKIIKEFVLGFSSANLFWVFLLQLCSGFFFIVESGILKSLKNLDSWDFANSSPTSLMERETHQICS